MATWEKWTTATKLPADAGVYVLVGTGPLTKLNGSKDRAGLLYVGECSSLRDRLKLRGEGEYAGTFNHHLLYYVLGKAAHAQELGPIELPIGPGMADVREATHLGEPRIFFAPTPNHRELEQLLLIKHFFEFGQFPPFNAHCPSIKSIYDHWEKRPGKKPGWRELWKKLKVDDAWKQLRVKATGKK